MAESEFSIVVSRSMGLFFRVKWKFVIDVIEWSRYWADSTKNVKKTNI
jgi:hypothetical protein